MTEHDTSVAAKAAAHSAGDLPRLERLLTSLSSRLIDLPPGRIDEAITEVLERIVAALGVDRSLTDAQEGA